MSPPDGSIMGGFSDLEIGSRTDSVPLDGGAHNATFGQIYDIPRVVLPLRTTAHLSKLEQLPKQIFMRIMMYCGYKDQVLLKKCSYGLYLAVDLVAIPWEEKTATILFEERNNSRNFPKKPSKAQNIGDDEDGADEDEHIDQSKRAAKRKRTETKADSSTPKSGLVKTKAQIDTYGKWGCYYCFQILPAHYFEGALLEDKEGRTPKSNKIGGASAAESDKKVDMRVEYIQILETIPGHRLPDWLSGDRTRIHATDAETYLRKRMERGVNCDDLRDYYKDIIRDTHLVAPIRGITPVFTSSSMPIPRVNLDFVAKTRTLNPNLSPRTGTGATLPAIQTREDLEGDGLDLMTSRPLYKLQAAYPTHLAQTEADSASYTYQIHIPRAAKRDTRPLKLPNTNPVGRIRLPPKTRSGEEPVVEVGDVVSLRRICIPCGTKLAVYRRNCNRKIISKTDEHWWVCDCPEVRIAGKSTGCPACGRKVIY